MSSSRFWSTVLMALAGGVVGCAGGGSDTGGSASGPTLTPEDFRGQAAAPAAGAGEGGGEASATGAPRPGGRPVVISDAQASQGLRDVTVLSGQPENAVRAEAQPLTGSPYLVDSLIGQINGKPVYASRFLAPLDGVLRAKAAEAASPRAWADEARNIIGRQLANEIQDELLLAESRAALSPEQRQGLIFFMQQIRENLAAQNQGVEARAEEQSMAQEGLSLDQKVKEERDKALIRAHVDRTVRPRVNISWRDVQRQYERDFRVFNPPPAAVIRMIFVPTKNAEGVQKIKDALAAGGAFAAVASDEVNNFARADGGLIAPARSFEPPKETAKLFEDPILNKAAQGLAVGQTSAPFELGQNTVWMHLEGIEQKPGRSLEEVQLEIQNQLRTERFNRELQSFYNRILERGSRTSEDEMLSRLLIIAAERYLIPSKNRPSGANPVPPAKP